MPEPDSNLKIGDVVKFVKTPRKDWCAIDPFSVTVTVREPLTIQEENVICEALVEAASKIKTMRGNPYGYNFTRHDGVTVYSTL